jgi:hypothetical protein
MDDMELNVYVPIDEITIKGKSFKSDCLNINCTTLRVNVYDGDGSRIGVIEDEDKYLEMLRTIQRYQ